MRRHHSRFLVSTVGIVLLLSLVMALAGCSGGGGGAEGGVVSMMKKLPKDADYFSFINVRAFRADKDLDEVYKDSKEDLESDFEELGISAADVDTMAEGGGVTILEGSFSLEDVRDELKGNGYDNGEYKGIETWKGDLSVSLVSASCIVAGEDQDSVEDCIDVVKGDAPSLYDSADARDVVGRLPSGLAVGVSSGGGYLSGLKVVGTSGDKKDANTLRMTMIYLFEDEDAAGAMISRIKDQLKEDEESDYKNAKVTPDGRYVKVTAEMAIENASSGE